MEEQKISVVNIPVPTDCEEAVKKWIFKAKLDWEEGLKRQKCVMVWNQLAQEAAAPKKEEAENIEDAL